MNNKRKIYIIIGIILIVIGVLCICLFFSFGNNNKIDLPKDNEKVEPKEGYDEFGNKLLVVYETKDEVYDVIVKDYLRDGETIVDTREENGCWYYKSSNNIEEFEYCIEDPIIRIHSTYVYYE